MASQIKDIAETKTGYWQDTVFLCCYAAGDSVLMPAQLTARRTWLKGLTVPIPGGSSWLVRNQPNALPSTTRLLT
jgi:hypothetical protein